MFELSFLRRNENFAPPKDRHSNWESTAKWLDFEMP